jgi:hypothetical protein
VQSKVKTRRLLLIAGTLAIGAFLSLVAFARLLPHPGVSEANFERVEIGMTEAEVEAIFGQPPLDPTKVPFREHRFWMGEDRARVIIQFQDGVVTRKIWTPSQETALERICRWLHWD